MARTPRSGRLDERFKAEIARILIEDLKDPRLDLVTVTGVEVSKDTRHARVYVIAHGDEERYREALEGLGSASGRIRSLLARRVDTRFAPDLDFRIDPSVDEGQRIDEVLRDIREDDGDPEDGR